MRVAVEYDVDVIRWVIRRYVLQPKPHFAPHKVDNQWPFVVTVAISSHYRDSGANCPKLVKNGLHANVAEMPDFISVPRDFAHFFWQTIVRVCQNENAQEVPRFVGRCHCQGKLFLQTVTCRAFQPHVSMHALICATADVT
jgi:hypothetical protein